MSLDWTIGKKVDRTENIGSSHQEPVVAPEGSELTPLTARVFVWSIFDIRKIRFAFFDFDSHKAPMSEDADGNDPANGSAVPSEHHHGGASGAAQ
jgi:hypothetical protein